MKNYKTRKDHIKDSQKEWDKQMEPLVAAYLEWKVLPATNPDDVPPAPSPQAAPSVNPPSNNEAFGSASSDAVFYVEAVSLHCKFHRL
jgi:hypothetical protein